MIVASENIQPPDPIKYTVLIVDDNPKSLAMIANYLEEFGIDTLVASNGESALKRARYTNPDIILLDVLMPGMDGFETCCRLKSEDEIKEIPVIFMTALTDTEHKIRGFSVGAVDYITKPIQQEELLARINTHLENRKCRAHLQEEVRKRTIDLERRTLELERVNKQLNMEINERKRAEEELDKHRRHLQQLVHEQTDLLQQRTKELEDTQANMLKQAHEAGMAEMASEILHHIGNALTPSKICVQALIKHLKASPLRSGFGELLSSFQDLFDAAPTIPSDEKERFAQLTQLMPENIQNDYEYFLDGLMKIDNNYDHITSILMLQKNYGSPIEHLEKTDINQVAEDALKMLGQSINKSCIEIKKYFQPLPTLIIDKNKLLQIFINLIKNSLDSINISHNKERRIHLSTRLEKGAADTIVFSIRDTGVGFTVQEKKHLFSFGYTSKESGSAFGLHFCANYLISKNGSIEAISDGHEKGAEFIVRLAV